LNINVKRAYFVFSTRNSEILEFVKIMLMLQVLIGHLIAINYHVLPELTFESSSIYFYKFFFRFGPESAFIFVFLSGFLVGGSLLNTYISKVKFSYSNFIINKLWRLFPTILVAVLITFILDYSAKHIFDFSYNFPLLGIDNVGGNLGIDYILGTLLSLQPVFISPLGTNGPLWTLGYIVNFYVFGLLALFVFQRVGIKKSYLLYVGFIILLGCINIEWMLCFLLWCFGALLRCYRVAYFSNRLFLIGFLMCILVSNLLKGSISIVVCGIACVFLIEFVKSANELNFPVILQRITHFLAPNTFLIYALHLPICFFIYAAFFSGLNQSGSFELYILTTVFLVTVTSVFSLKLIDYDFKK
tara:strand:- start:328 stop:1401 length:1074 start_codon:yes stop_codon:yes gene_type:complete